MPGIWPPHEPPPSPVAWWTVLLGGVGFAAAAFVLIWIFAVIGFLVQGAGG